MSDDAKPPTAKIERPGKAPDPIPKEKALIKKRAKQSGPPAKPLSAKITPPENAEPPKPKAKAAKKKD